MCRPEFHTRVYPRWRGAAGPVDFFVGCRWRVTAPAGLLMRNAFLAPHLPFSVMPRRVSRDMGIVLDPLPGGVSLATEFGFPGGEFRLATLRFLAWQTLPMRGDQELTFQVAVLLPPQAAPACQWDEPSLGAPFFNHNRMRLFLDYGLLSHTAQGGNPNHLVIDPSVECGYLEYPGCPCPPTTDDDEDESFDAP